MKKVKPLPWKKIILLPKTSKNRPDLIWNYINEIKLDRDEIIEIFGIKNEKIEIRKFLDMERTQEVSNLIQNLPETEVIEKALKTFDKSLLNTKQVDQLLLILITEDELEMYNIIGKKENWDKEEQHSIKINNILNHKSKLQIWSLINKIEKSLQNTNKNLNYIIDACNEIKSNKHFTLILSIILGLGNILNGDTILGQADGFCLDILKQLPKIKDNFGNSILSYIFSLAKKIDNSFVGFQNQFPCVEKAVQLSKEETTQDINEIINMIAQFDNLLKNLPEDEFKKKSEEYLENFKENVKQLEEKDNQNKKTYIKLVKFYGYNDSDEILNKSEVFFEMLLDFFQKMDEVKDKNEIENKS